MKNYLMKRFEILRKETELNSIIVWPDVPYWLYLSDETIKIIQIISKHSSYSAMIEEIKLSFGTNADFSALNQLFDELCYAGVIVSPTEKENISQNYYVIRTVTINITDVCNLYCKHCYINSSSQRNQFMSLHQAKVVIDSIVPYMTPSCSVIVSGGEALLNPDCIEILNYISSTGKGKITLVTNGTTVTEALAEKLSKIQRLSVQVSLDGATPSVHEAIRGKSTFSKTIQGINFLTKYHIRLVLSPMVTEALLNQLEDYFSLAKKLNAIAVFLQPINNVGRARQNKLHRVRDVYVLNKLIELYEKNPDILKFVPGSLEAKYISSICLLSKCNNCGVGSTTLLIQPNGDLYPCPNNINSYMFLGNIFSDSFSAIWNNSKVLRELRNIDVDKNLSSDCKNCVVKHFCGGGCRGVTLQNTNNLYAKSPICAFEKEQRIEMIWIAAQKPNIFAHEVSRSLDAINNDIIETANVIKALGYQEEVYHEENI